MQSCPLLVLFMQIHDLASLENFGQKLSKWKHFPKSLNHFSSLLRLQSPFFWQCHSIGVLSHGRHEYLTLKYKRLTFCCLFLTATSSCSFVHMLKYHLVQPPSHCLFNIFATTPSNLQVRFFKNKFLTTLFLSPLTILVSA